MWSWYWLAKWDMVKLEQNTFLHVADWIALESSVLGGEMELVLGLTGLLGVSDCDSSGKVNVVATTPTVHVSGRRSEANCVDRMYEVDVVV